MTKPKPKLSKKAAQTALDQAKKAAQTALDQVAPQAIEMAAHAVGIPLPPGSGKLIHGALKQSGAYDKIFKSMSSLGNTQTFIGNIAGHAGSTDENKQPEEEPETQEELDLAASLCKNSF